MRSLVQVVLAYESPCVSSSGCYTFYNTRGTPVPGRNFKGVTSILRDWFLIKATPAAAAGPASTKAYRKQVAHVRKLARQAEARSNPRPRPAPGTGIQARLRGHVRGTRVHAQLADYIGMGGDEALLLKKYPEGLHPMTRALKRAIKANGWCMVRAEFVVHHEAAGVAYAIDLICYDEARDQLVLIELKTGYGKGAFTSLRGVMETWHPRTIMAAVCAHFPPTPVNKAHIQQALGCLMFEKCVGVPRGRYASYIMHVDERMQPIFLEQPRAWLDEMLPRLEHDLCTFSQAAANL